MTDMNRGQPPQPAGADDGAIAALLADPRGLWEAICRTSCEYIVLVDRAGIIRFCNRTSPDLELDDVLGKRVSDFLLPDSAAALEEAIGEIFASGTPQTLETRAWGARGEPDEYSLRLGPVFHGPRVAAVLVCCEDVLPLKVSERQLEQERTMLQQHLTLEAHERQLVSYEIHDGLAQYVAGALMHLQVVEQQDAGAGNRDLEEAVRLVRRAAVEARRLVSCLRPPSLDDRGIIGAIETLAAEARSDIPEVVFEHPDRLPPLDSQLEIAIYRIVQESLSNARKHASARRVRIALRSLPDRLQVEVHDDGSGFDPARVPDTRFGLEGIRRRGLLLGGDVQIDAAPGRGTVIRVDLPLTIR